MFTKRIYLFIISLFLCFGFAFGQRPNQERPQQPKPKKQAPKKEEPEVPAIPRTPFIRFGIDPSEYGYFYLQPGNRRGLGFQIDAEVTAKLYPALDFGWSYADNNTNDFNLECSGYYGKIGFDYNFLEFVDENEHDIFFFGARVAYATYKQIATDINLSNTYGSIIIPEVNQNFNNYWGEFTVGVKTEIFKNWYLGWTGRGKMLFTTPNENAQPYLIPGYGKYNETSRLSSGLNVYLLYSIPLKRK